jgi:hypothetical protein
MIRNAGDRETASVDLYQQQLRRTGAYTFVTSTRILKPLHDRAYFHLIYATRNAKGILKFRDVERRTVTEQDRVRATAQRTHRESKTGQSELGFEPTEGLSGQIQSEREHRLNQVKQRLFEVLRRRPIGYDKLQPLVLEIPLVWNADLNLMLKALHDTGQISIEGLEPRQRIPRAANIIRLRTE